MRPINKIKKRILSREVKTDPQTQDKILAGALAQLDAMAGAGRRPRPAGFFRTLFSSRLTQLAAAAGIVAAIFLLSHYVGRPVDVCSVAIGKVSEKMDNVHTFTYCYRRQVLNGRPEGTRQTETVLYISPEHGVRLGTYVDGKTEMQTFLLPAEKVRITVIPDEKQYTRDELTEQTLEQVQQEKDPRRLIRRFLSSDYRDLGCAVVGGIRSHGFEVTNPGFLQNTMTSSLGRLWINVKTHLPVRMELEGTDIATSNRVRIVADEFRWDADLQKEDFGPFIPDDYVLEKQEEK